MCKEEQRSMEGPIFLILGYLILFFGIYIWAEHVRNTEFQQLNHQDTEKIILDTLILDIDTTSIDLRDYERNPN